MVVFPIIAAGVSTVFAVLLFRQYAERKRLPQLAWGTALSMYALSSLIVAAGVSQGWDATLFKGFWLFGAMLNVPYLALGSIALLGNRVATIAAVLVIAAASLFAVGAVLTARAEPAAFVQQEGARGDCPPAGASGPLRLDIPRGKCVWGDGSLVGKLGSAFSIPSYLIVVGIAAWTARARGRRSPPLQSRVRGNWLIAGGATIVALGGTAIARLGRGAPFGISLALGVALMFAGFTLASRGSRGGAA